jgi:hypothetical protein
MTKNARGGLAKTQRLAGTLRAQNHRAIVASFRKTMPRRPIELLRRANGHPIIFPYENARVFPVETNFHRMARRPGGVSRQQALANARREFQSEFQRIIRRSLRVDQTK